MSTNDLHKLRGRLSETNERAEARRMVGRCIRGGLEASWWVERALGPEALRVYNEAMAMAQEVYDEALRASRKTYNEVSEAVLLAYNEDKTERKVYDADGLKRRAWDVYEKAKVKAHRAYRESVIDAVLAAVEAVIRTNWRS